MRAEQEQTATMTVTGTVIKGLLFLAFTFAFAAVGWNAAAKVVVQNGFWFFLGYIALIALTFAAVANPRIAAAAGAYFTRYSWAYGWAPFPASTTVITMVLLPKLSSRRSPYSSPASCCI